MERCRLWGFSCNTFRPWHFCTLFYVPRYIPVSLGLYYKGTWLQYVFYCCVKIVWVLIMLNWFMVYLSGLLYPSTFLSIHSINFWEFNIKIPTKKSQFIYLKIIAIYTWTICNFVLYFPSSLNVLSYSQNLKRKKMKRKKYKEENKKIHNEEM